jgi:hypothetical protein
MVREHARNPWSVIVLHEGYLELRWLPSTAGSGDDAFTATVRWFAEETERTRPRGVLSDIVDLRHVPTEKALAWRRSEIIPRYAAAGVRRFAFLVAPGHPDAGRETVEGPAVFPTRWFVDRADAVAWLEAA